MIRICVFGHDNVGWSIDKDRSNLLAFLEKSENVRVTKNIFSADVYWFVWADLILSPKYFFIRLMQRVFGKKIIAWVTNDIIQSSKFLEKKWPVDLFIAPSEKISSYLKEHSLPYVTIPFYVSPDEFHKLDLSHEEIARELNIDLSRIAGKKLIGSFQRDSEGGDLMKPKWQKNPELLIQILKTLPKEAFVLVLAGPRRHYLVKRCQEENIQYVFVGDKTFIDRREDDMFANNLGIPQMNLLYNLVDTYVVTSKSEGGPKAILEAGLTKTLICSTDVGFARDFLHPDLIYSEEDIVHVTDILSGHADPQSYIDYNYQKARQAMDPNHYVALIKEALKKL